jgi:hypothetical protein
MKNYYRVMLGKKSSFAEQCFAGDSIGVDFGIAEDLTHKLPDEWRAFCKRFIPVFLAGHPDKTKVSAGLACGALWTVAKGIRKGDMVLCPDGAVALMTRFKPGTRLTVMAGGTVVLILIARIAG